MPLNIPELSLVLMVGASGSGKSTFAARHFAATEVLSSDHFRGVVSNDHTSQEASADAFEVLEFIARKRLARGLLTVIDATNVAAEDRKQWVKLAREYHVLPVAIVLDVPPKLAVARNKAREGCVVPEGAVRRQSAAVQRSLRDLRREGFRYIHVLRSEEEIEAVTIERPRPWTDRRDDAGPFDLIGDVHGCLDELVSLIGALGWTLTAPEAGGVWKAEHPGGRRLLFLGDLVDRGPASHEVLRLAMDLVDQGVAICVPGNHEVKLLRWLRGEKVTVSHGLEATIAQLETCDADFRARVATFIDGLVSHYVLDGGKLVVAHAGMREELAGRASGRVRQFALYGDTTGETDAYGLPVRYPWAEEYQGRAAVVYGHTPVPFADWLNNTICIDTGCVFGGELTALRWPERELVSVPALQVYHEPMRPLVQEAPVATPGQHHHLVDLQDVQGRQRIETRYRMTVPLQPERSATALEVLSRFALDPRWLIHLPPTMSPSETSARPDLLEHPDEAFDYYRKHGVRTVVCEEKHMGSRALVLVGREREALARRFGFDDVALPGVVISRRGRRFFKEAELEAGLIARVQAAVERAGFWERFQTDWVLLDAELMPWSAKARELLTSQYAPVGAAAKAVLDDAARLLAQAAARQPEVAALQDKVLARAAAVQDYSETWRRYCWDVGGPEDLRLAPFHLLATEGKVHTDQTHAWHMNTLAELADDGVLQATRWRQVELDDAEQVEAAVAWWTAHTEAGGEGMVVKPLDFLAWHKGKLVQPALKCRGRSYLRIIYGPEYTQPENLRRLRERAVKRKRSLAIREFALGLEALERFVAKEALRRVHAPVFGVLALESEEVDPRL
jgi:protein phosphatase